MPVENSRSEAEKRSGQASGGGNANLTGKKRKKKKKEKCGTGGARFVIRGDEKEAEVLSKGNNGAGKYIAA